MFSVPTFSFCHINRSHLTNLVVALGLGIFISGCASLSAKDKTTAENTTESQTSTAARSPAVKKIDTVQDAWEKQHAAFLRSLDFATIDQQKNAAAVYTIKTDIINSRYHIRNSETNLTVEHNVRSALRELRWAKQSFARAVSNAAPKELHTLDNPQSMLNDLIKRMELSMQNKCDAPDHADYRLLEAKLEDLLATL
jgi:hypothetical protein